MSRVKSGDVRRGLKILASYEDTINTIQCEDMPVKAICDAAERSVSAWGDVIREFNDVVTALEGEKGLEDRVYKVAFKKALEIVLRAMGGYLCER